MPIDQSLTLASLMVREHFGVLPQVVFIALENEPKTFTELLESTKTSHPALKRALLTMAQYGFVVVLPPGNDGVLKYQRLCIRPLELLWYPTYVIMIGKKYGVVHQAIIEEALNLGCAPGSILILNSWKKLQQDDDTDIVPELRNALYFLIVNRYLIRTPPYPQCLGPDMKLTIPSKDHFWPPDLSFAVLYQLCSGGNPVTPDRSIMWRPNFDRFHQDTRDQMLIDGVKKKCDDHSAVFMETLIRLMYGRPNPHPTQSNPIPIQLIKEAVLDIDPVLHDKIYDHIRNIERNSPRFIRRCQQGRWTSVILDFWAAFYCLTFNCIECLIKSRYGLNAVRIFRLLQGTRFTFRQLQERFSNSPVKDMKFLTLALLRDDFIQTNVFCISPEEGGPRKFHQTFYIDYLKVTATMLNICFEYISSALMKPRNGTVRPEENEGRILVDGHPLFTSPKRKLMTSIEAMIEMTKMDESHLRVTILLLNFFYCYETERLHLRGSPAVP